MDRNLIAIQNAMNSKHGYVISSINNVDNHSDIIRFIFKSNKEKEDFINGNLFWSRCRETSEIPDWMNDENDSNYSGYGFLGNNIAIADLIFSKEDAKRNEAIFYRNRINSEFLEIEPNNCEGTILTGHLNKEAYATSTFVNILKKVYEDDDQLINVVTSIANLPEIFRFGSSYKDSEFFKIIYNIYTMWWENICNYKKTLEYAESIDGLDSEMIFAYKNGEKYFFYQDVDTGEGSLENEKKLYDLNYR